MEENNNMQIIKSEPTFIDDMKDMMNESFVDGILPKLKPMIGPAVIKLEEYFGDDSKVFFIRRLKNSQAEVFVFDNTKGDYIISNKVYPETLEGKTFEETTAKLLKETEEFFEKEFEKTVQQIKNRKETPRASVLDLAEETLIKYINVNEFVEKMITGEFTSE